jgi:LAO/AO transport system kinase
VKLRAIREGGKASLASALALIETSPTDTATLSLLSEAYSAPEATSCHIIGLTGPPGVGKSTLLSALIAQWRAGGRRVGIIAVDPSSHRTGGALLGDRTRLATDPEDEGLFIRSMAARDRLGGLAALTYPATILMRTLFDIVVVETVGVGQSETDISNCSDSVVLCLQPGAGDALQFMKAGILEIPDLLVVNKADLGEIATRTMTDIESTLAPGSGDEWVPKVLATSAHKEEGIEALINDLASHLEWIKSTDRLLNQRQAQAEHWVMSSISAMYGASGLSRLNDLSTLSREKPFQAFDEANRLLGRNS